MVVSCGREAEEYDSELRPDHRQNMDKSKLHDESYTEFVLLKPPIIVSKYLHKTVHQVQCLHFIALKCSNSALGPSPANVFKVKQKPQPQWVNKSTFR